MTVKRHRMTSCILHTGSCHFEILETKSLTVLACLQITAAQPGLEMPATFIWTTSVLQLNYISEFNVTVIDWPASSYTDNRCHQWDCMLNKLHSRRHVVNRSTNVCQVLRQLVQNTETHNVATSPQHTLTVTTNWLHYNNNHNLIWTQPNNWLQNKATTECCWKGAFYLPVLYCLLLLRKH